MSDMKTMWHVVMPQAIRIIIPPLANEVITMFKNTSLVTVIRRKTRHATCATYSVN